MRLGLFYTSKRRGDELPRLAAVGVGVGQHGTGSEILSFTFFQIGFG